MVMVAACRKACNLPDWLDGGHRPVALQRTQGHPFQGSGTHGAQPSALLRVQRLRARLLLVGGDRVSAQSKRPTTVEMSLYPPLLHVALSHARVRC